MLNYEKAQNILIIAGQWSFSAVTKSFDGWKVKLALVDSIL